MSGVPGPRIDSTVFRRRANGFNAEMTEPLLDYIVSLPKAELHLHLEGSLEPEMMLALAERNKVEIPYSRPDDVRAAHDYGSLQDFLDLYYAGMGVLCRGEDFEELTLAYLRRAAADGVVHAEVFFDPQAHTARGIRFDEVTEGILAGLSAGERETGATTRLIMCFLRDLSQASAIETFNRAAAYFDDGRIIGVGLDSAEIGNPAGEIRPGLRHGGGARPQAGGSCWGGGAGLGGPRHVGFAECRSHRSRHRGGQ